MTDPVGATGRFRRFLSFGPRRSFRWTAFVLAVTSFSVAIPTPLYPVYEQQFHFSAGVLGLVFAAYTPGVLLTLLVVAPTAERTGRKGMLRVGMVLMAASALVFAFASGVVWLALARLVAGLAVGATTSVATAAMSDLEPYRDEHHVARVAVAANFGGFAIGVLTSGLLVQTLPFATQLVYALPLVATVLGLLAIRGTEETATSLGALRSLAPRRVVVPADARHPYWVAVGGIGACYAIYGLFAALVPSYVRGELGIASPLAAGSIVATMFGLAAITQLATSQIRDRRALLLGFPLLLGALVVLVFILPLSAWVPLVLVTLTLGVAVGLTFMGSVTLVDRIAPENLRGGMLAEFYSAGYLALAIPTIGVAVASDTIGLTDAGVVFGSVLAIGVALLYLRVQRTATPAGGGGRVRTHGGS